MISEEVDNSDTDHDAAGAVIHVASDTPVMFPPDSGSEAIEGYRENPQAHWAHSVFNSALQAYPHLVSNAGKRGPVQPQTPYSNAPPPDDGCYSVSASTAMIPGTSSAPQIQYHPLNTTWHGSISNPSISSDHDQSHPLNSARHASFSNLSISLGFSDHDASVAMPPNAQTLVSQDHSLDSSQQVEVPSASSSPVIPYGYDYRSAMSSPTTSTSRIRQLGVGLTLDHAAYVHGYGASASTPVDRDYANWHLPDNSSELGFSNSPSTSRSINTYGRNAYPGIPSPYPTPTNQPGDPRFSNYDPSHSPPTHRHSSLSLRHSRSTNRAAPYSLNDSQPGRSSRVSVIRDDAVNSSRALLSSAVSSALSSASGSMDVPGPQAVSSPEVDDSTRRVTKFNRPHVRNITALSQVAPGWYALILEAITLYLTEIFMTDSVWDREDAMLTSAGESIVTIFHLDEAYRKLPDSPTKVICLPLETAFFRTDEDLRYIVFQSFPTFMTRLSKLTRTRIDVSKKIYLDSFNNMPEQDRNKAYKLFALVPDDTAEGGFRFPNWQDVGSRASKQLKHDACLHSGRRRNDIRIRDFQHSVVGDVTFKGFYEGSTDGQTHSLAELSIALHKKHFPTRISVPFKHEPPSGCLLASSLSILHQVSKRVDGIYKKNNFDTKGRKKFVAMALRLANDRKDPEFEAEFKLYRTQLATDFRTGSYIITNFHDDSDSEL